MKKTKAKVVNTMPDKTERREALAQIIESLAGRNDGDTGEKNRLELCLLIKKADQRVTLYGEPVVAWAGSTETRRHESIVCIPRVSLDHG